MVREFHEALNIPVADTPTSLSRERLRLRLTLIAEEVAELVCALTDRDVEAYGVKERLTRYFLALAGRGGQPVNLASVLHEACDVHVVVSGTMVEMGLPEDAAYAEIHAANMRKANGPTREDGKRLKPLGWIPADVGGVIGRAQA